VLAREALPSFRRTDRLWSNCTHSPSRWWRRAPLRSHSLSPGTHPHRPTSLEAACTMITEDDEAPAGDPWYALPGVSQNAKKWLDGGRWSQQIRSPSQTGRFASHGFLSDGFETRKGRRRGERGGQCGSLSRRVRAASLSCVCEHRVSPTGWLRYGLDETDRAQATRETASLGPAKTAVSEGATTVFWKSGLGTPAAPFRSTGHGTGQVAITRAGRIKKIAFYRNSDRGPWGGRLAARCFCFAFSLYPDNCA